MVITFKKKKKTRVFQFLDFSGKPNFLESVLFHREMFCATNFGIVLGFCIVHVLVFIKQYVVSMFRINFCEFLKILILIIFTMMTKLCLGDVFKGDENVLNCKKNENITPIVLKNRLRWCFWILNNFKKMCHFLKNLQEFHNFRNC